jgi:pimeloyl-ACP methyl ester carboxylesterase
MLHCRLSALAVALGTLAAVGCADSEPIAPGATLALDPCQLSMPGRSWRFAADCGTLEVPENHDEPGGAVIELRIAVAPAISRDPEPDPLILLAGGPGQAATEAFLNMLPLLDRIREKRDLVMVDQRGTGVLNRLVCPEEDPDPARETDDAYLRQWTADCRARLEGDPTFYRTRFATLDLDRVREALGYETVNLYGGSYGTRAAIDYLRTFPERVRSIILDGVVPAEMPVGANMGRDAQRALDLIFERCQNDAECAARYPGIAGRFADLLQRLEAEPIVVELPDPTTGKPTEVLLDRQLAAATVRLLSYSTEGSALIPLLIDAAREGDLVPLAAQSIMVSGDMTDSISSAMMFSVLCAEDVPFYGPPDEAEQASFMGAGIAERFGLICDEWGVEPVEEDFKEPFPSDVPVLLLSGEADPVTPPSWGEAAGRRLSRQIHIVAPQMGHIVLTRGCIPRIAARFVEQGALEDLDLECVEDLEAPPFFLDFTGPAP